MKLTASPYLGHTAEQSDEAIPHDQVKAAVPLNIFSEMPHDKPASLLPTDSL
jgi:hypothetical protein